MPPRGNDWLALTAEPTLEPEVPICDPHHHFWEQRPEPVDYQRYLLEDLAGDINSGHNVRSTVFVEARSSYRTEVPEELRSVGEVEFVQRLADASATGQYGPGRAAGTTLGPGRKCCLAWVFAWRSQIISRRCRSWPSSPRGCQICLSSSTISGV